jgi:hypothetical protein
LRGGLGADRIGIVIPALAIRPIAALNEHLHRSVDFARNGRRNWLGRASLLPLGAGLIAAVVLLVIYWTRDGRLIRQTLRDAVPALRRLFGFDCPSMARARRSQSAESRARAALETSAVADLARALDRARRVAARLLDALGAVAATSQPRLATALVARSAAI